MLAGVNDVQRPIHAQALMATRAFATQEVRTMVVHTMTSRDQLTHELCDDQHPLHCKQTLHPS